MSDYPPVDSYEEDDSDIGSEMSAMQEERYLLTMALEAQKITLGKSRKLITREHAEVLLKLLEMYADDLFEEKDDEF